MRHLGSFALAIVLAPLIWALSGVGIAKLLVGLTEDSSGPNLIGLATLVGAGGLYCILVLVRLSPVGPGLVGIAYLGVTLWMAVAPATATDTIPRDILDVRGAGMAPAVYGMAAVLAIPLLATIGSPRRWRRYAEPPLYGATVAPAAYSYPASGYLSYTPPSYPTAETETTRPLPPSG